MWELFAGVKLDSLHRSGVKWDAFQFGHLKGGKRTLEIGNTRWKSICAYVCMQMQLPFGVYRYSSVVN